MTDYIEFYNKQRMPIVGLGLWQSDDPNELDQALEKALDQGYRHFDTATLYKNEEGLGRGLKKYMDAGKVTREELFIVTKLPWTGMHPDRVRRFAELSLKKLQVNYIDLYLVHWPLAIKYVSDEEVAPMENGKFLIDKESPPLESVWKAMEELVDAGLVKSIGISNFTPSQIERIMKIARIPPTNHQIEVQAYFQNREVREASTRNKITVCAYGPLGSPGRKDYNFNGFSYDIPNLFEDPLVVRLSEKYGKTPAQVLLRFLTQLNIAVIPKSTNAGRLSQNINILDFALTPSEVKEFEKLDKGEAGRSFPSLLGMQDHPECPF